MKGIGSWSKTESEHFMNQELDDGSILVLAANDDKSTEAPPGDGIIHKTRHCIEFCGNNVLFGFVWFSCSNTW